MQKFKVWDQNGEPKGDVHPVSDEWHATHIVEFPGIERMTAGDALQATRDLLLTSNDRRLTKKERAYLSALDAVRNINATHRELARRDIHKVFGEIVPVDKLKFTDWTPDTCECTHRFVWRRDHDGEARQHFGHRVVFACDAHAHNVDPQTHHDALRSENVHKNNEREKLAGELGVDVHEVTHSYDADRVLHLHHRTLNEPRICPQKG